MIEYTHKSFAQLILSKAGFMSVQYQEIGDVLRQEIREGRYVQALPSENQLVRREVVRLEIESVERRVPRAPRDSTVRKELP